MKKQSIKIVLIGNPAVGKSNLLTKYAYDKYDSSHKTTIGVEFAQKTIQINDQEFNLAIWDTCGSEQYRALTKTYYQGAAGALLLYDITDQTSFDSLQKWLEELNQNTQSCIILLIGNKIDLNDQRKISKQDAAKFAFDHRLAYIETSAKEGINVQQAFEQLATEIVKIGKFNQNQDNKDIKLTNSTIDKNTIKTSKDGCC